MDLTSRAATRAIAVLVALAAVTGCKSEPPPAPPVAVGGTVTGLKGTGLVLQDNGGDDLAIKADGPFVFATKLPVGSTVAVTVKQAPTAPSQRCVVTPPTTVANKDISDIAVQCTTSTFAVGGTVTGLKGTGLVLQDNDGDDLPVDADGTFHFATPVASGATFTVTVKTQPASPTQTCAVVGGSGTIAGGDVTSVAVNCSTNTYTVGGTIAGLVGSGLVLEDNGGDDLALNANGTFGFATPVASGGAFQVTVKSQPSQPTQTCVVTSGEGTVVAGNVTTVAVQCTTNTYAVGGTISGLKGVGLVLQDNGGDDFAIVSDGTFAFPTPVASGAPYHVTASKQPAAPSQTCVVANDSGSVVASDVTGVAVTCTTNKYTVGGTVTGLSGHGLVLRDNGGDDLPVAADGTFTFPTPIESGLSYAVTVGAQPTELSQTCVVAGGTGQVGGQNVGSVTVNCTTNQYAVGGAVEGLVGGGLTLTLNDNPAVPVSANGTFAFPTALASGTPYTVRIASQPTSPWQTCALTGESGTVTSADVASVHVACTTNKYAVGGTITGLAGTGLVLRNGGGDDLAVTTSGSFHFAAPVASGTGYAVTIAAQPSSPWQTCTVTHGSGTVGGSDIADVAIDCRTNTYAVSGTISGLAAPVVLQDNAGDDLTLNANGSFTFPTQVASGQPWAVTVKTQPTSPWQTCAVTQSAGGQVTNAPVTDVAVVCTTNTYAVGGTVAGLTGSGLVLQDNSGDDLPVSGPSFTFLTRVTSGRTYAVTVKTQPTGPSQTCSVSGGSGTVGGSDVRSVSVNCTTNTYAVGGTVTGLRGSGLVLQDNNGDDLSVSGAGTFAFATPVPSGAAYSVTVKTQPTSPWQTCSVASGSGTVTSAPVSSVQVTCTTNTYNVSVAVTGLSGGGLVLQDNGASNLAVTSNGTFPFATQVASGSPYNVTVLTQPTSPWQTCTAASPTGTMANGITVQVTCTSNRYTVGGTVSGLVGSVVLRDNGGDDLTVSTNGTFTFATPVASGAAYAVTVQTQPANASCTVASGTGTVAGANVTTVSVTCSNRSIPGFSGQVGPDFSAQGYRQCVGYLDQAGTDDIPNSGWANPCIGTGYNTLRVACGANAGSVRYIDVSRNIFATGLNAYPETGLITGSNFTPDANMIYASGNQPNTGTSWWVNGNGCGESYLNLTINNGCSWEASNCFGQNLSGARYLYVYVHQ